MYVLSAAALLAVAFAVNLPLGAWRNKQRKLSPAWFIGIHASIPLLFLARSVLDVGYAFVPPEIAMVLAGQVLGARMRPATPWRAAPDA